MTTRQIETATVLGTITQTGNASVTVTAYGMTNSPKTISVAVTDTDSASIVGGLIRTALAFDTDVAALFLVSGAGANVVLTKHVAAANDSTLNIAIDNGTCTGLTPALTSTNTTAGTGLTNGYCTLAQLKSADVLNFTTGTNLTAHDEILETIIEAVSRLIDNATARQFYASTETRYYNSKDAYCIETDDIASASGVTVEIDLDGDGTYEYTLASTDYDLAGYNDLLKGWPYTKLETTPAAQYTFSKARKGNKVTASFGWAAVPKTITLACILQSNREYQRFKTALGVAGTSAVGTITLDIPALDPDVEKLVQPYRRLT
jgi:hypothetical protein